ncbi:hypothetical protein A2690_01485 [Candidatus Roizmanbacteria bacterium RIFCSPHIGHO2_01_FULL_39_12b]|uniref:Thioredoxin domain-containing protein n=1 Tax=Candidatus Roizmanbacteria bacterium RIFCSPHIGHO2_01_FULL_39_12b TaxID=1802030 RepID=A0A1F7GDP7_9BACT|nr:MAG: hypothetical protein A2690_01485 [Candidatus Roizmanbacteria bacterium RIFCSPHIGHO2_01_FULL_39_12b]
MSEQLTKSKQMSFNPVVILLIVAAFAIGFLYNKVDTLEKGIASENTNNAKVAGAQAQQPPELKANLDAMPKITDKDHIRGNKDADVVLVNYSDFECPFCKRFHPTMLQIMKEYGNKVAWVYRHFPLSFHANAQKEAEASECAAELGGNDVFWKYTDAIYEKTTSNGTGFALDALVPLAKELGLNESKFKQCLDSGKYAKHIQEDMAGGSAAGVSGTPGTIIVAKNGKRDLINGALPFEQAKEQIDVLLK